MHELSLLANLMGKIDAVARSRAAKRVTGVKIKLGALAHISGDHLREHFVHAARGTVAEGARLDVELSADLDDPHAQDILLDSLIVEE